MNITLHDGYGIGQTLTCPCCNNDYLHHDAVTVFSRREDAEFVRKTTVVDNSVATDKEFNDHSGNPSSRRDGLSINFWCETCGQLDANGVPTRKLVLHIAQHKGNTIMRWEVIE
jgi:hypothetical protein